MKLYKHKLVWCFWDWSCFKIAIVHFGYGPLDLAWELLIWIHLELRNAYSG